MAKAEDSLEELGLELPKKEEGGGRGGRWLAAESGLTGVGMSTPTRPIASIKIGPRFRKEHRNIPALAKNIAEIGLIHPVVITPGAEN